MSIAIAKDCVCSVLSGGTVGKRDAHFGLH